MHTSSGLFTYLDHRLGRLGVSMLLVLAVVLAVAAVLLMAGLAGLLATAADPVQVAPVRWTYRS
jgi:hypothetical protein